MVTDQPQPVGTLIGFDLTVPNAEAVRDFYASVVGWQPEGADQGGYEDYFMKSPTSGEVVAGVCHARGENADLPPQWLVYVTVTDLEASLRRCAAAGGSAVTEIKGEPGGFRYCVIRDPAGAVLALAEGGAP
jgi:predicted enzyme related to lactoylglutathione lyase